MTSISESVLHDIRIPTGDMNSTRLQPYFHLGKSDLPKEHTTSIKLFIGDEKIDYSLKDLCSRIESIIAKKELDVEYAELANSVYGKLKDVNTLLEIDDLIVAQASDMAPLHYEYPVIASWIVINRLHQSTHTDYLRTVETLFTNVSSEGLSAPMVSESFYRYVKEHISEINTMIKYDRDYEINYFGFRTLERSYLKRTSDKRIIERPQHFFMRVAISLHYRTSEECSDRPFVMRQPLSRQAVLDKIRETYDDMSLGYYTHATPTLFNAGTLYEQLSSCFLLGIGDDMEDIGNCWKNAAIISKHSGGIGIHASNIRCDGAYIKSTGGRASGMRLLKVFNEIAQYADQGGKRAGSIAIYLEPWHADIFFFLDLRKNTGAESERTRDLFMGLMINDLFMHRVENNKTWSLMCPNSCPNIVGKYGEEFEKAYLDYEKEGQYVKQVNARDVWNRICASLYNAGTPYIINKDAVNRKSNQINVGVINGSNLCAEIVEYSDKDQYAVCNLASICLPKFIQSGRFDFERLMNVSQSICNNLNNIIDINYYPLPETRITNERYRPIGIGVQGLADVFAMMKMPFDSIEARDLNKKIFETIYYGAMSMSVELAKKEGRYQFFDGSPFSQGKFQFDLWDDETSTKTDLSGLWDWDSLRQEMITHGTRNSLLTACMPTASTSQIMGNNETTEPYTQNIYTRSTLAGEFYICNQHLMKELMQLGMWSKDVVGMIKYCQGSIASLDFIPENIRAIYRTSWEIHQMSLIEMAADRGRFIDQTQSMNLFIAEPCYLKLNTCLFHGWRLGLKTLIYYLRTKAGVEPTQFGIDPIKAKEYQALLEGGTEKVCKFVPKRLRKEGVCYSCDG